MKFAGWYGIVVGLLMLGQWGVSLTTGKVPELQAAPLAIGFHLAAEVLTALLLILSGLALLKKIAWGRTAFLTAGGMLLYSIINSPGYFTQRGEWAVVGLFGILFLAGLAALMGIAFSETSK